MSESPEFYHVELTRTEIQALTLALGLANNAVALRAVLMAALRQDSDPEAELTDKEIQVLTGFSATVRQFTSIPGWNYQALDKLLQRLATHHGAYSIVAHRVKLRDGDEPGESHESHE